NRQKETMQIDLNFPVEGDVIPTDHAYLLYSALSHVVPQFHDANAKIRFSPINGDRGGKGLVHLIGCSRLRVRLPADPITLVLPLAGRPLELGEHRVALRLPTVIPLVAAPTLVSKIVVFKNSQTPERFLGTVRWKLDAVGVGGEFGIPLIQREGR